jgi:hypothetical protein
MGKGSSMLCLNKNSVFKALTVMRKRNKSEEGATNPL